MPSGSTVSSARERLRDSFRRLPETAQLPESSRADPREAESPSSRAPRRAPWHSPVREYSLASHTAAVQPVLRSKFLRPLDCIFWRNEPRNIPQAEEYPRGAPARPAAQTRLHSAYGTGPRETFPHAPLSAGPCWWPPENAR